MTIEQSIAKVNANMEAALSRAYQRGIEVGRAAAQHEADEFAALTKAFDFAGVEDTKVNVVGPYPARKAPKVDIVVNPKAIARGIKKAPVARTKGVKEAIVALLASVGPMEIANVISNTGFKANSVRGTLMTMKKKGEAQQLGKEWILARMTSTANGPAEGVSAND